MPPYAGLDEGFHVARVSFVAAEGRQPRAGEVTVPDYLGRSMAGTPDAPPGFGTLTDRWSGALAARPAGWKDVRIDAAARRRATVVNYEAQQPSLYYAAAAAVDRAFGDTQLHELLALRLLAIPFGVVAAVATALLGVRLWGRAGFLGGVLLLTSPTWITLVARAGNDAPACAALAAAILLSSRPEESAASRWAEAGAWGAAVLLKVYAWPAALLLPLLWPPAASRRRRGIVAGAVAAGILATAIDLRARTGNPIGSIAFAGPGGVPLALSSLRALAALDWLQFAKVFAGSAIWTSGQHANFFRPAGLLLYVAPWLLLVSAGALAARHMPRRPAALLAVAALVFAGAELAQAWGFLREAVLGRAETRSAGLAGWYLHAFDPIWFGAGFGFAAAALVRRRRALLAAVAIAGTFLGDVFVTEGALFRDYAGLSSPLTPGALFRWGGGDPWEALVRLGRYGVALPSPWVDVGLRLLEASALALLVAACGRAAPGPDAAGKTV